MLNNLAQQGTPTDVIERIREMPLDQMPFYIGALRKNPSADWATLSSSVVIPKKQAPQWNNFELQLVGRYDPTFRQWALIQLRKMRTGQNSYGDYTYRGFEDVDERAIFGRLDNMFGELYDWYEAYAREYPRFDLASYNLAQALKHSEEWHDMMAGKGEGLYYTPLQRDESGSITDERVVHQWDDGWYVTMVTNENDLAVEGNKMGHCVGGYCYKVESGTSRIFSLRDPMHQPHITVEMDGNDNIVRQIQGRYNGTPEYKHRERMAEWLQSLDNARWEARDGGDDDIYWGSHPEEIRGAIYDTVYGRDDDYYDEDDDYGLGRDREEKDVKDADVGELYDSAMDALGDTYWDHKSGQRVPRRNQYTHDLDEVAEALAEVAVAADKAKMQEVIANGVPKPYYWQRGGWNEDYEKQTPFEKGYNWWVNYSQVKALHDKLVENLTKYRDENMEEDEEWSDHAERELAAILPHGMDFAIDEAMKTQIDEEYLKLFQQITGMNTLPLDRPLSPSKFDRNHPRLFTHVSDFGYFGDTVPHDPETGEVDESKYDGEWKYAKRKFRRLA